MLAKERYGFLPVSWWAIGNENNSLRRLINDTTTEDGYSEFLPGVAQRCYEFFSAKGETIFDPFAGKGTRAIVAKVMGRNYVGYDISPRFVEHALQRLQKQKTLMDEVTSVQIVLGDSRNVLLAENSVDMVFTCPPYWDLEMYEGKSGDVSHVHGYMPFMLEVEKIILQCYRVLKKGRYCVWVVGDINRDNELVPYHADLIQLFLDNGFRMHDIAVYNFYSASVLGVGQRSAQNHFAKSHEYVLVFKKPVSAVDISDLMLRCKCGISRAMLRNEEGYFYAKCDKCGQMRQVKL